MALCKNIETKYKSIKWSMKAHIHNFTLNGLVCIFSDVLVTVWVQMWFVVFVFNEYVFCSLLIKPMAIFLYPVSSIFSITNH